MIGSKKVQNLNFRNFEGKSGKATNSDGVGEKDNGRDELTKENVIAAGRRVCRGCHGNLRHFTRMEPDLFNGANEHLGTNTQHIIKQGLTRKPIAISKHKSSYYNCFIGNIPGHQNHPSRDLS